MDESSHRYAKQIRITISLMPLHGCVYRNVGGVLLDERVRDISRAAIELLKGLHISTDTDRPIHGHSWEYSAYAALRGLPGVYTGCLAYKSGHMVALRPGGVEQKRSGTLSTLHVGDSNTPL